MCSPRRSGKARCRSARRRGVFGNKTYRRPGPLPRRRHSFLGGVHRRAHPQLHAPDRPIRCRRFNAWVLLKGLETLAVARARARTETAAKVADALAKHPKISRLLYPGRSDHPQACAGEEADARRLDADRFLRSRAARRARSAASTRSKSRGFQTISAMPRVSSPIRRQRRIRRLTPEARAELGISEGFIRFSAGLEHADDLIEDFGGGAGESVRGRIANDE